MDRHTVFPRDNIIPTLAWFKQYFICINPYRKYKTEYSIYGIYTKGIHFMVIILTKAFFLYCFGFFLVVVLHPSQPTKVMSSRSVYLTKLFLGRLSPPNSYSVLVHILLPETAKSPSWISVWGLTWVQKFIKIFLDHFCTKTYLVDPHWNLQMMKRIISQKTHRTY